MSRITTFLMFNTGAEEAAKFYTSIFKNSKIHASSALSADIEIDGTRLYFYNGGPHFKFSEGMSLFVSCETQEEVDYYWNKLREGGGEEVACGWLKDRYGLAWQVFPTQAGELLSDPDPERSQRAMKAMLSMKKIDLAAMRAAADGA
jgi:predicted 3-demethylubiquinone-9 3-methyltransferase (glyoxalase superfamily)